VRRLASEQSRGIKENLHQTYFIECGNFIVANQLIAGGEKGALHPQRNLESEGTRMIVAIWRCVLAVGNQQ